MSDVEPRLCGFERLEAHTAEVSDGGHHWSLRSSTGTASGSIQPEKLPKLGEQVAGQHLRVCRNSLDDALSLLRRKFRERALQLSEAFLVNDVGVGHELHLLTAQCRRRERGKVAGACPSTLLMSVR